MRPIIQCHFPSILILSVQPDLSGGTVEGRTIVVQRDELRHPF
jgi:hypothetical protein